MTPDRPVENPHGIKPYNLQALPQDSELRATLEDAQSHLSLLTGHFRSATILRLLTDFVGLKSGQAHDLVLHLRSKNVIGYDEDSDHDYKSRNRFIYPEESVLAAVAIGWIIFNSENKKLFLRDAAQSAAKELQQTGLEKAINVSFHQGPDKPIKMAGVPTEGLFGYLKTEKVDIDRANDCTKELLELALQRLSARVKYEEMTHQDIDLELAKNVIRVREIAYSTFLYSDVALDGFTNSQMIEAISLVLKYMADNPGIENIGMLLKAFILTEKARKSEQRNQVKPPQQ